jgi:predicted glycoside hydrolase/deacetylase ChbG (UPF0249 family)
MNKIISSAASYLDSHIFAHFLHDTIYLIYARFVIKKGQGDAQKCVNLHTLSFLGPECNHKQE